MVARGSKLAEKRCAAWQSCRLHYQSRHARLSVGCGVPVLKAQSITIRLA